MLPADHDRYGEGQYEDPTESTEATDELAEEGAGLEVISHRGERHQTPPERLHEGPTVIPIKSPSNLQREEIELSVEQLFHCSLLDFF